MPLHRPRRIFIRRRRIAATAALRIVGAVAVCGGAAAGVYMLAGLGPSEAALPETTLPRVHRAAALRTQEPDMRVAATLLRYAPAAPASGHGQAAEPEARRQTPRPGG